MKNDPNLTPEMLSQHPGVAIALAGFTLLLLLLLAASISTWVWAVSRWTSGKLLLSVAPWRPRAWGLIDLIFAAGLVIVGQVVGFRLWASAQGIDLSNLKEEADSLGTMAVGSAILLAAMILMVVWLLVRYATSLEHIGLALRNMPKHLGLGLGAAAMWLPVVMVIMAAVSLAFSREYDHPLVQRLNDEGTLQAYLLAVFAAVAVAPLVEEFLFRVLLQGWLQSLPWSISSFWWFTGANRDQGHGTIERQLYGDSPEQLDRPADEPSGNPYQPSPGSVGWRKSSAGEGSQTNVTEAIVVDPLLPPVVIPQAPGIELTDAGNAATEEDPNATILNQPAPPIWPVFVSGTLFGLAHFDYGLSFVPLIILGIVLGFLYRATHSIWPCVVLHFSLNAFSMIALGVGLLVESIR